MKRLLPVLAIIALFTAYPVSYLALRLSHALVHVDFFISEEGLNAHHFHGIDGDPGRQRFYRPLIACELWWWEHWRP